MDFLALAVEISTALLTLSGIAYGLIALLGARNFERSTRAAAASRVPSFAPGVSILKPVKGLDPSMYAALLSHCTQQYAGAYEIVFGVNSLGDPAVAQIARLRVEHPAINIRLVECAERLGPNGKVSNLAQMLPHATFEHILVNDSDIRVSPFYLQRIMEPFAAPFAAPGVGLVTAPYIGRAGKTLWSRLEALGIATDFMPGVLTAKKLEGAIRFGLGSTLATTKAALSSIGGFESLVDVLADDYEIGARLSAASYRVELAREVVETTVPAYTFRSFVDHQLRWSRGTRDSRRAGYIGLGFTYAVPWALATVVASGFSLWAISLLSIALLVRVSVALTVGVGILRDGQVLHDILLLPLRDCFGLFFWAWSYASDAIVWRSERFRLKRGRLSRV